MTQLLQWINPTAEQLTEAEALAASIGETPFWQGQTLCVGQPEPAAPVPDEVTMRQARIALLEMGLLDTVEAAINAIPDAQQRRTAQLTWEYSSAVQRHNPLIQMLGPAIGVTEAQIDAVFRLAETK